MKAKLIFIWKKINIEVLLQIKLSGCPTKGYFNASCKNAFLSVKWPFFGQPDNFITPAQISFQC
jgi:hypothetical protein